MSKKDQSNAIRNIGKPCAEMLALATVGDCAISRDIIRWHRGKHFDEVTVLQVRLRHSSSTAADISYCGEIRVRDRLEHK